MHFWSKYKSDFRLNLKLALPIMAGQLGQVLVNFADNVMVGQLGASALAGVSFANAIYALCVVFGMGISFALPPLIAEAVGAEDNRRISSYFKHSLVINIGFGILSMTLLMLISPWMYYMGQDPEIVPNAQDYLWYSAIAMIPFMIFQTLRSYSDGMSQTLPPMIVIILGNVINIVLNYILIFGHLGIEAMGVSGASLGSLIARSIMVLLLLGVLYYWKNLFSYIRECRFITYRKEYLAKILKLGVPISFQMTFEVTAFSAAAIIMGLIGKDEMAAHQIAINLASITFMICTGLAMAATIRVGNQLGKRDVVSLKAAAYSALIQVTIFMSIAALGFVVLRDLLPTIYIHDIKVIEIASLLLILAAIFQIPDGIQVTSLALLRGLQDVRIPTIITFISYWAIGIPSSYILAITLDLGPIGVWIGLIVCLSISATLLTARFRRLSNAILT